MATTDGATAGEALTAETLAAMEATTEAYLDCRRAHDPDDEDAVEIAHSSVQLLAEVRRLTAALDGIRDTVELPATATTTEVVAAVEERAGMLAHAVQSWKARASGMEAAEREIARLRRQMEHATPWQVSEVPTDEEMRALRMRWAFGPEKYQADADSLIAAVIHSREEIARLRAIVDAVRSAREAVRSTAARYDAAWTGVESVPNAAQAEEIAARLTESYMAGDALSAALDALLSPAADDVARDAPGVG